MVQAANRAIVLKRERELNTVHAACHAARSGHTQLIVLDGPAGIGKTLRITTAAQAATAAGLEVGRTSGGELEQDLGWSIAASLPRLASELATERPPRRRRPLGRPTITACDHLTLPPALPRRRPARS